MEIFHMTDKTATVKTKFPVLGALLTVAATAIATAVAMKKSDKIVAGFKTLAQHAADGTFAFPPAKAMNGKERQTPAAT